MWSEQVGGEAIEGKLWPRGAALAERLWSDLPTGGVPAIFFFDRQLKAGPKSLLLL